MSHRKLILASSSRYRQELLARLRLAFTAISPAIDETPYAHEQPQQTALRLACAKAQAIAALHRDALVIGSDQVAALNDQQIGKPGSHAAALRQLQDMRGQRVLFHSGLCLLDARDGQLQSSVSTVTVQFRHLPDEQLEAYLRAEQPYDVTASAKCEGLGIALIERIDNHDPTALIGLPLIELVSMLRALDYPILGA